MTEQSCSCNKWELTGMPCKHALAAIFDMRKNNASTGLPETWVHTAYWLKTWKEMYAFKIEPINGRSMWVSTLYPTKLVAPHHHVPIGRPKKRRRRGQFENDGGRTVKCSKCGNLGHNGRSCKGQSVGASTSGVTGASSSGVTGGGTRGGGSRGGGRSASIGSRGGGRSTTGGSRGGGRNAAGGSRGGGRSATVGSRGGGRRGGGRSATTGTRGGGRTGIGGTGAGGGSRGGGRSGVGGRRGGGRSAGGAAADKRAGKKPME